MRLIQINLDDPTLDGAMVRQIEDIAVRQKAEWHASELKKIREMRGANFAAEEAMNLPADASAYVPRRPNNAVQRGRR